LRPSRKTARFPRAKGPTPKSRALLDLHVYKISDVQVSGYTLKWNFWPAEIQTIEALAGTACGVPGQLAVPGSTTHSACTPLTEAIMSKSPS
jgi:hypothetical protein